MRRPELQPFGAPWRRYLIVSFGNHGGDMNWDAVQLAAKAKGVLVFAMDQAQTDVLTQPGPWGSAFDGYCIGLAANWVSLAYKGENFPFDAAQVCDNPPWQGTLAQNLSDAIKRVDWTDGWKAAVEPLQCHLSPGLRAYQDSKPTAGFLWSIMSLSYGCFGVSLRGGGGAHAIALRHGRDNRYHLFDSNYFHIATKGVDTFKSLLKWYLGASGYDATYTKAGIVGIRPPINPGG
jgi:hypothetical protein